MLVEVDFAGLFQVFCLVQGFTCAAWLAWARPRLPANRWLALLLTAMLLQVTDFFLSRSGIYARHKWLYFAPLFFSLGFGPLLLAYVRAWFGRPGLGWRHFVPVAAQVLCYVGLMGLDVDAKAWFWQHVHKPVTRFVEYYGALLSWGVYLVAAARVVRQQGRRPRWLWHGLQLAGALAVAAAVDPLVNAQYLPPRAPRFYLHGLVLPVLTYGLALLGWRESLRRLAAARTGQAVARALAAQPAVPLAPAISPVPPEPARPATPRPPVDPAQLARVVAALETEHLYRDPELTLDALGRHVGLSPNTVSHLLNGGLGQSFADLINGYRLAEVKRRLATPDAERFTVLALALDAGFNSKTTFNRLFKEKTGLTPREYRRQLTT